LVHCSNLGNAPDADMTQDPTFDVKVHNADGASRFRSKSLREAVL
jgi:hypothetical protein